VNLDDATLDAVVQIRTPLLTDVVVAATHLGGAVATTAVAVVAALALLRASRPVDAMFVGGAMLTVWPVMTLLKNVVGRPRPPMPERLLDLQTLSFPSGHAMTTAALATVLAVVAWRTWPPGDRRRAVAVSVAAGYTIAVGLSRVYLAAHWLTDVLVGWGLGVLWALLWVRSVTSPRAPFW